MNGRTRGATMALGVTAILLFLAAPSPAEKAKQGVPPPRADRKALERVLSKALDALPAPAKEFREDRRSGSREVEMGTTPWAVVTKAPAQARGVRVFEKRIGRGEDAEVVGLELRVYVNQERALPEPLGSEGGTLETFTHDGLPGMRVGLAGVSTGGRVALPLTAEELEDALSVVRLHVAAAELEPYMVQIAEGRRPETTPWDKRPPAKASEVRTIVVEFHGPSGEVERLVKATRAAPLRALLTP